MNASGAVPVGVAMGAARVWSRGMAGLGVLLLAGGALAMAVESERPLGVVEGRVTGENGARVLAGARISLSPANDPEASSAELDDSPLRTMHTVADAQGHFHLARVPAGDYYLTASTRAHSSSGEGIRVAVLEGEIATASLALQRSQPVLNVAQHWRGYVPGEAVSLPVRGYLSGSTGTMRVRVWKGRLSDVLQDPGHMAALQQVGSDWGGPRGVPGVLLGSWEGAPQLISNRMVPISSADTEGFFHQAISLPSVAGFYLVEVRYGTLAASAWVQVGATALVTKKAGGDVLAFAADVRSGRPRPA